MHRWAAILILATIGCAGGAGLAPGEVLVDDFDRPDSLYHGDGWESLNPGYWKVENGALRRRLKNVGDRARNTGFPYHWETHRKSVMPVEYDPSLPFGMIWRRDWKLRGNYTIRMEATVRALPPGGGDPKWRQNQPGYALMGVCFGGESLFEGWTGTNRGKTAAWMAAWGDDGAFGVYDHATDEPKALKEAQNPVPEVKPGDRVAIELTIEGENDKTAALTARLKVGESEAQVRMEGVDRKQFCDGLFGLVGRGLLDFEVDRVVLKPGKNRSIEAPANDCQVCYALGDTLRLVDGKWRCRFVGIFRSDGAKAEIRIADSPKADWANVPVAGSGAIVTNDFRLNTALIDVTLPESPAEKTLYYTVWKDGRDVTADPREGYLGRKDYVGRLPQLKAPYRLCGLG